MPKYQLKSFDNNFNGFSVETSIDIESSQLQRIYYEVIGDVSKLSIPSKNLKPIRANDLWQTTCFEFFIKEESKSNYVEFNFSPSSNWNCYHFESYRKKIGDLDLPIVPKIECKITKDKIECEVILNLNLNNLFKLSTYLISPTLILHFVNDTKSFWAVNHCGANPDFHLNKSFFPLFL